ncbi:hypothetical protein AAVH_39892 [Aphelenchoides avenae]|nr:hypothetical protein AAVH_39892 [Aphelenchus avenae]
MTLTLLIVCLAASLAQLTAGTSLRYTLEGYALHFCDQTSGQSFIRPTQDRMMNAFFTVYPPLRETYNTESRTTVNFCIDPKYKDVAEMRSDGIHFNPIYLATIRGVRSAALEYDAALHGGAWSDFFEQTLGYTVVELWAEYASYPDM